jgi:O-antigen/teichoic acid export membrane protein
MLNKITFWLTTNRTMFTNAVSLIGTTAVTSVLGFAYWFVAARYFTPAEVGFASAAIAAMMLLGSVSMLGLGTLLIGEVARRPEAARSLTTTGMLVSGASGGLLGVGFSLIAPWLIPDLAPIGASFGTVVLYAAGVSMVAFTSVVDLALVGRMKSMLQFWRNAFFAAAKLVFLILVGIWVVDHHGMLIYATWVVGGYLSMLLLIRPSMVSVPDIKSYQPKVRLMRTLGRAAVTHHTFNLILQTPGLLMPILVTAILSAKVNAAFYISWMIAGFVFVVPNALATVLHALGAARSNDLAVKMRMSLGVSYAVGVAAIAVTAGIAPLLLGVFGESYLIAATCLPILVVGVLPLIIRQHFLAICRFREEVGRALPLVLFGGTLELSFASSGAYFYGLNGLAIGWVLAICVEALLMFRTVYSVAFPRFPTQPPSNEPMKPAPQEVNDVPVSASR